MASDDGTIHGMTVNSFSLVSLDPMLVLVCLKKTSRSLGLIERARAFAVNVLSAGQHDVSRRFAAARPLLQAGGSGRLCTWVPRAPHDDDVLAALRSRVGDTAFEQARSWAESVDSAGAVEYALGKDNSA